MGRLDILVNNAGITRDKTLRKMTDEDWLTVLNTNLNACYFGVSAVMPMMIEQKYGRIVNISSFVGQAGNFGQATTRRARAASSPSPRRRRWSSPSTTSPAMRSLRDSPRPECWPRCPKKFRRRSSRAFRWAASAAGGDRESGSIPGGARRLRHRAADQRERRRLYVGLAHASAGGEPIGDRRGHLALRPRADVHADVAESNSSVV